MSQVTTKRDSVDSKEALGPTITTTGDQTQLLIGVQAQKHTNRSSVRSVPADDKEDRMAERGCDDDYDFNRCLRKGCGHGCPDNNDHHSSSSPARRGRRCESLCLTVSLVVFLLCGFAFFLYQDRNRSAEVQELRQRLSDLEKLFDSHGSWSPDARGAFFAEDGPGFWLLGRRNADDGRPPVAQDSRAAVWGPQAQPPNAWAHKMQQDSPQEDHDDEDEDEDEEAPEILLQRWKRQASSKPKSKKNRHCKRYERCVKTKAKGKKIPKRCKKILDCDAFKATPAPQPSPAREPPIPSAVMGLPRTKVVHFTSDYWKSGEDRKQKFGKEAVSGDGLVEMGEDGHKTKCRYLEEWKATACINRTALFAESNTPFKFLHEADWMKTFYKNKSEQPIQSLGDGGYSVKQSGLYLIYSSVMFHDMLPRHSQAAVVNGDTVFKCMDSVDYIDTDLPKGQDQAKYKSCTMTAITHLRAGDRLELQNLYANSRVDLSTDATYWGAALLTPGELKINN